MKLLGDKIKEIRKGKNISQQELADKLFVSDKTISSWEKNRTEPNLDMIVKISALVKDMLNNPYDSETDKKIDDLVFKLYGMSDSEIEYIEKWYEQKNCN